MAKINASGRWLRSLRDHNHLREVVSIFLSIKVELLRGHLREPWPQKCPIKGGRYLTLMFAVRSLKIRYSKNNNLLFLLGNILDLLHAGCNNVVAPCVQQYGTPWRVNATRCSIFGTAMYHQNQRRKCHVCESRVTRKKRQEQLDENVRKATREHEEAKRTRGSPRYHLKAGNVLESSSLTNKG